MEETRRDGVGRHVADLRGRHPDRRWPTLPSRQRPDRADHDGHVGDRRRRELPRLRLLQRLKDPDVNLRAATTFSFNDFISNGGILIAGVLVLWLGTNWPDLLVGFATAIIAIKGGVEILRDARAETKKSERRSS
jgi:Co/Zn/Cd efflux system component